MKVLILSCEILQVPDDTRLFANNGDLGVMYRVFGEDIENSRIFFRGATKCRKPRRSVIEEILYLEAS